MTLHEWTTCEPDAVCSRCGGADLPLMRSLIRIAPVCPDCKRAEVRINAEERAGRAAADQRRDDALMHLFAAGPF